MYRSWSYVIIYNVKDFFCLSGTGYLLFDKRSKYIKFYKFLSYQNIKSFIITLGFVYVNCFNVSLFMLTYSKTSSHTTWCKLVQALIINRKVPQGKYLGVFVPIFHLLWCHPKTRLSTEGVPLSYKMSTKKFRLVLVKDSEENLPATWFI